VLRLVALGGLCGRAVCFFIVFLFYRFFLVCCRGAFFFGGGGGCSCLGGVVFVLVQWGAFASLMLRRLVGCGGRGWCCALCGSLGAWAPGVGFGPKVGLLGAGPVVVVALECPYGGGEGA